MNRAFSFETLALALGAAALLFLGSAPVALGQEGAGEEAREVEMQEEEEEIAEFEEDIVLEEMVVTGSRAQPRSVTDSAVPVDVVKGEDFSRQGGSDVPDLLRNLVPSYNVNLQPISDAATVVRPPNLRGLAPDHALVLVNGKRRHRASVIYWLGNGIADAAQGQDTSPIPAIALRQVEVLRDGASAQYGSDAIAGVMNFQLKDSHEGASLEIKPGIFQAGDGFTYSAAGNIGLGSEDAWANLSLEYGNADETDRSVQRADAAALIEAGNADVADPAQPWGQPFIRNDIKLFANYGAGLSENIDFYGHANYAAKEVEGGFYFRNPNTRPGVFSIDEGATLLVGDLDGVGQGGECPTVAITDNVPDPDALAQVFNDDNCFTFREAQGSFPGRPGGFTPRFGGNTTDRAALIGIKGTNPSPTFTWDLSASYGRHHSDFFIFNTVNASLGPDSPTSFDPGDYIQADTNLNLDLAYPVNELLFLAAGLEYRTETFEIVKGQRESFEIGPLASQGFSSGSNGFPGFGDIAAGSWSRSNVASYVEAEVNPLENWLLAAALRYENFDDFGSTTNYKLATNYGITDELRMRGSYSTGFRAPTPGQQNAFNVTTEFGSDSEGNFILVNKGTIPSTHPAAELVGGKGLEPEKSKNYTVGAVVGNDALSLTIDYFDITVEDRMTVSSDKKLTEEQVEQLEDSGINARNLQEFRFFTNDFATGTRGIDLVATAPVGAGELSLAYNYTDTEVTKYNPELLNNQRITLLEKGLPRHRGNVTLTQAVTDDLGALGRVNYYGSWNEWPFGDAAQVYGAAFLLDLEAGYSLSPGSRLTLGAQNLLNVEPEFSGDEEDGPDWAPVIGRPFGEYSPYGFGGAFWYLKYSYSL